MKSDYRVDEWGRVIINPDAAFSLAYKGVDVFSNFVDDGDELRRFNACCRKFDKTAFILQSSSELTLSPEQEHKRRARTWLIDDDILQIDVRTFLLSLCNRQDQIDRIKLEMDSFESRGLVPLLQTMIFLVDHFRQNGVVLGCGRGSSVASYILFLLGVHKIDSLKYGLNIEEFLKPTLL